MNRRCWPSPTGSTAPSASCGAHSLGLLVIIKNKLTPEQQTRLKGLKTKLLVLHSKGDRVEAGVRRWQEQGRDPSPVAQVMQEAEPLIRDGKLDDAEAVLDRALKLLAEATSK